MPPTSNGNSRKVQIASMRRQIVMMPRLPPGFFIVLWRVIEVELVAKQFRHSTFPESALNFATTKIYFSREI